MGFPRDLPCHSAPVGEAFRPRRLRHHDRAGHAPLAGGPLGLLGLLVGLGVPLGSVLDWIWAAVAALIVFTIVNRIRHGLAERKRLAGVS